MLFKLLDYLFQILILILFEGLSVSSNLLPLFNRRLLFIFLSQEVGLSCKNRLFVIEHLRQLKQALIRVLIVLYPSPLYTFINDLLFTFLIHFLTLIQILIALSINWVQKRRWLIRLPPLSALFFDLCIVQLQLLTKLIVLELY